MKKTNVSIFIPHIGCPHRCSFCDQKSISGSAKAPSANEVYETLKSQSEHLKNNGYSAEIAFFGGSFTAIPRKYMTELLEAANAALGDFPVYTGIRCSTRPDCINEEILKLLKNSRVTAIELGAQSMDDEVLIKNERGHTAEDVRKASEMIKNFRIELGLQMMTGLYGDTPEKTLHTAAEFIKIKPATVRIYPTVILENTKLGELYKSGEYKTFSFDETITLCAKMLRDFEENEIKVIRLGLHASDDVERQMLGGVYHPSLREIVESELSKSELLRLLEPLPKGDYVVFTDKKNISKIIGQKRKNIEELKKLGYNIKVKEKEGEGILLRALEGQNVF